MNPMTPELCPCGSENNPGARWCASCGEELSCPKQAARAPRPAELSPVSDDVRVVVGVAVDDLPMTQPPVPMTLRRVRPRSWDLEIGHGDVQFSGLTLAAGRLKASELAFQLTVTPSPVDVVRLSAYIRGAFALYLSSRQISVVLVDGDTWVVSCGDDVWRARCSEFTDRLSFSQERGSPAPIRVDLPLPDEP